MKDTLLYDVTMRGHVDPESGAVWSVNTMVEVDDSVADVHERLWILQRKLSYSKEEGAITTMTCIRPESFVIDTE